jgi:circadian clock protein KaiC
VSNDRRPSQDTVLEKIEKASSGIYGLDEITGGGLPRGRVSLVSGGPGCGKTLLSTEFLVRGALDHGEPGVFLAFEETPSELARNVASLGFDLDDLVRRDLLAIDHIHLDPYGTQEACDFDLEGLFFRLGFAIDEIGAKRVVLDTLEALFSGFDNEAVLRAELRRLFHWLKDRDVTAIVTAERGDATITRFGLEEYVSDCVIVLDHRVKGLVSTRHLRIVKYRGSRHGTNEYPFLIGDTGLSILPVTSVGMDHAVSGERVSSGIDGLDEMLEGKGFHRGSSVLITGTAGTGKSSLSAHFADSICRRGETCLMFAFEESPDQIIRNMKSIGIDLKQWIDGGLLHIRAARPTLHGLEMHLLEMHRLVQKHRPSAVIIDPISNLMDVGDEPEVESILVRLIDYLKSEGVTSYCTSLSVVGELESTTRTGISSVMDTWILLKIIESNGERNRGLYVLKARGIANSNQIREMKITRHGVKLVDAYVGRAGVLTGTARYIQEGKDRLESLGREQEQLQRRRGLERKRRILEARIAALEAEFEVDESEVNELLEQDEARDKMYERSDSVVAKLRRADSD